MEKRLLNVFNEIFDVEINSLEEDLKMEETDEWNSLIHMELISVIEEKFQIDLTFDDIKKMVSLKEIRAVLKCKEIAN
ncbi:MAG: acyl carrier protein [Promethearchaeota archaeon]